MLHDAQANDARRSIRQELDDAGDEARLESFVRNGTHGANSLLPVTTKPWAGSLYLQYEQSENLRRVRGSASAGVMVAWAVFWYLVTNQKVLVSSLAL